MTGETPRKSPVLGVEWIVGEVHSTRALLIAYWKRSMLTRRSGRHWRQTECKERMQGTDRQAWN
jgi:hypothetical protein